MNGCKTPYCERTVAGPGHNYCSACFAYVWRHGKPPELQAAPAWMRRFMPRDLRRVA